MVTLKVAYLKDKLQETFMELSKSEILWIQKFRNEEVQVLTKSARSGRPRVTTVYEDMAIVTASK